MIGTRYRYKHISERMSNLAQNPMGIVTTLLERRRLETDERVPEIKGLFNMFSQDFLAMPFYPHLLIVAD